MNQITATKGRLAKVIKGLGVCALALGLAVATPARSELLYATNGTSVARFDSANLASVTTVPFAGLQAGETIVGFDVRADTTGGGVNNGMLYGIGSGNRLYLINPLTGVATQVGGVGAFTLNGTSFGIDFNPVPDRIRIVSNTEQSLRVNPNDGTLSGTDTSLTPAGNVVGVAYDRNDTLGSTPTTLFGIDSAAGTLVRIGGVDGSPSPNLGAISTIGSLGLGTSLNEAIGFDISAGSGIGFASITVAGQSRLYSINLTTGAATNLGLIGLGATPYQGLTAAAAPIPEPGTYALLGVGLAALVFAKRRRSRAQA